MMRPIVASFLVLASCASSTPSAPTTQPRSSSTLASKETCEDVVENYERREFLSTTTPVRSKMLFGRVEHDRRHRDRVRHCQVTLTERQASCIATARSLQYVENCFLLAELQ